MNPVTTASIIALFALASSTAAAPPVLRQSPDFTIKEPSGKITQLSGYRGKVVLIEFFFIRSPKCLRLAQTMNKLQGELGPRGFQPVAIAFGPDADEALVAQMVQYFKLTYPVGYASADDVDNYLVRQGNEILNIPQVVAIDRAGVIRAQSGRKGGEPTLESEDSLRRLIDSLLKEGAPASGRDK
jgi:peroxiredoxin